MQSDVVWASGDVGAQVEDADAGVGEGEGEGAERQAMSCGPSEVQIALGFTRHHWGLSNPHLPIPDSASLNSSRFRFFFLFFSSVNDSC